MVTYIAGYQEVLKNPDMDEYISNYYLDA